MECHFILTLLMPKGIFNGVSDRWKFLIHIDRQQMVKGAIYKRLILKMFSVKKKMPTTKWKAVSSNPTCLFTPSESEIQSHLFQANKTLHFFLAEVNGSECEDLFPLSLN